MRSMQRQIIVTMLHKTSNGTISTGYSENTTQNDIAAIGGGAIIAKTSRS